MRNLYSLFLSQAYRDCWDDYNRSLKLKNFPKWDYVILTASNEQQAEGFRKQIEERRAFLPKETTFVAIPDRDGKRVGSGGATLEVLKYLHEQEESFDGLRILVIHSGGDSKRVPQYSALGKLFSPVPHALPSILGVRPYETWMEKCHQREQQWQEVQGIIQQSNICTVTEMRNI